MNTFGVRSFSLPESEIDNFKHKSLLMLILDSSGKTLPWPLWKKMLFRFFFVFMALYITPWTWLDRIPKVGLVTKYYYDLMNWAVRFTNEKLFHVKKVLVPLSGSGDTSWGWAQLWMILTIALVACVTWSVIDRKRKSYNKLDYWLCVFTRYYIAMFAFLYGIIKLFAFQMPFPNPSLLATSLGDFLPMRLSWMFMGYSVPYQVFSGAMEALAGLLLLSRRTATFGTMVATGVFINVMMMNLSYDIPVKIFSMRLVLFCLVLLAHEYKRIFAFFILNKTAEAGNIYNVQFTKKWMRITRVVLKTVFIGVAVVWFFYTTLDRYKQFHATPPPGPIAQGIYDVETYILNRDTIPPLITDTLRWQDMIFENNFGSIKTSDTLFWIRYRRGYFNYKVDEAYRTIEFRRPGTDPRFIFSLDYKVPDSNTVLLWGKVGNDSLFVTLKKSKRHFQLTERQFHWLSETNR